MTDRLEKMAGEFTDAHDKLYMSHLTGDALRKRCTNHATTFAKEIVQKCAKVICDYCSADGLPEDWIRRATATPAGDDRGPRFVHVYENGDRQECLAHKIWEAFGADEGGEK